MMILFIPLVAALLASCISAQAAPDTTDPKWFYKGCYSAPSGHNLDLFQNQNLTSTSIKECFDACKTRYAALGNGECYCANTTISTLISNPDNSNCTVACGPKGADACGGPINPITNEPTAVSLYDSQPPVPVDYDGWKYDGCIEHASAISNFTHVATVGDLTVERCLGACDIAGRDYAYAGLSGTSCYCGAKSQVPSKNLTYVDNQYSVCNFPCPANNAQACGGQFTVYDPAVSFYERQDGPALASSFDATATGQLETRTISTATTTSTNKGGASGATASATSTKASKNGAEGLRAFGGQGLVAGLIGLLAVL